MAGRLHVHSPGAAQSGSEGSPRSQRLAIPGARARRGGDRVVSGHHRRCAPAPACRLRTRLAVTPARSPCCSAAYNPQSLQARALLISGDRLGPYEIVSPLGSGGMGEVYTARDPRLNRLIAIKLLPVGAANDPERRQRFEREAQAVAALNHPNIVTIHSVEEA